LVPLPNSLEDVSHSLEREFILRRFNKDYLKMEISGGSDVMRIIGVGNRTDTKTGKTEKVTTCYPSHYREVLAMFEHYPITEYYGINIKEAMLLPIDQWYGLRKEIERIGFKPPKEDNEKLLLQILQKIIGSGEGG